MMCLLRKLCRLTAAVIWCIFVSILAVPGMFMGRRGILRNSRMAQLWAAGLVRIWNIRITCEGDFADYRGGLLISNHQGYIDILVEGALFPIRFLPKVEIRSWPVLGWMLALSRPIWVNRRDRLQSKAVSDELARSLKEGISALVYAEGTSGDGKGDLLPFKSTSFEVAVSHRLKLTPVLLKYEALPDGFPVGWYGGMTLLPHVWHLLGEPRIGVRAKLLPPIEPIPGEDRKSLAVRVHNLMNQSYQEML